MRDVIIVGSGPGGLTAALYAARAGMKPLVVEGVTPGGSLVNTTEVENFPSHQSIMGPDLMDLMRDQAESFGAEFITDDADRLELVGDVKKVFVGEDEYQTRSVILSMGSRWRRLGLGEDDWMGRGVSSCATCDGFFYSGQDVAVVGGGDSAMEEALFLTRFARSVTVLVRKNLRASRIMRDRAEAHPKISIELDTRVVELLGTDRLSGLRTEHFGRHTDRAFTGLFVAIGHDPRSDLLPGSMLTADGYVKVTHPTTHTGIDGVFACGDLVDDIYRQAITAAGTGCRAALDAERHLLGLE